MESKSSLEERIRQLENENLFLKQLNESFTEIIFAFDKDLKYTYWNKASEKLTGISAKEAIGKSLFDIFPDSPETRGAENLYKKVLETGQSDSIVNIITVKGILYCFEIIAYPTDYGLTVIVKDITSKYIAESRLQENEERFLSAIESLSEGFVLHDQDGTIILSNSKIESILGLTKDQLMGRTSLDKRWKTIREDGSDFPGHTHPAMISLKEGIELSNVIMGVYKPTDELTWISTNSKPIGPKEKPTGVVVTSVDITEQKQTQYKLIENRKLLENITKSIPDVIYLHDIKKHKTIYSNRESSGVFGYSDEEISQNGYEILMQAFHPDDIPKIMEYLASQSKATADTILQHEFRARSKDESEYYWYLVREIIYQFDVSGKPEIVLGVFQNITDRKKAEEELIRQKEIAQANENRVQSIIQNTKAGYFFIDNDGLFQEVNDAWLRLYKYDDRSEVIGKHFTEVQKIDNVETAIEFVNGIRKEVPEYMTGDFSRKCKDGSIGYHSFSARPVYFNKKITGIEGFIIDTTWKKLAEEELLKSKAKIEESEKQFRELFENMEQGFALHEMIYNESGKPVDYRYVMVNKAFENLTGLSSQNLIGKTVKEFLPYIEETWINNYGEVARNGSTLHFENFAGDLNRYYDVVAYSPKKDLFAVIFTDITSIKESQKELQASKEKAEVQELKYRALFENAPIGIVVINPETAEFIDFNYQVCKQLEYTREEFNRLSLFDVDAIESREETSKRVEDIVKNKRGDFETKQKTKGGDIRDVFVSARIIDVNNKEYYQCIWWDITNIKKNELELIRAKEKAEEQEYKYRTIFKSMGQGFYLSEIIYDENGFPCDYRYLDVNLAFEQMIGLKQEDLIGKTYNAIVPPDPESGWMDCFKRVALTGIPETFEFPSKVYNRYFGVYAFKPQEGKFCALVKDITDSKETSITLKRWAHIFEHTNLGITVHSMNSMLFELYNQAFAKMHGYSVEELAGKTLDIVISNEVLTDFQFNINLSKDKGHHIWESVNVRKDGSNFPVLFDVTTVSDDSGKLMYLVINVQDITERKIYEDEIILAKEKAEESDRLKTAFLQNMSHEIRTPMNAIMGFSELLPRNFDKKDKLLNFSNIIAQRCHDLLDIINDILDIAKIESGQMTLSYESCDLVDLFADLQNFFNEHKLKINKYNLDFKLQANCDSRHLNIITDKVKLKQILINLISNAFKYTDDGKIEGGCRLETDNKLLFYISDTGIGIPKDKYNFVFERFAQLDKHNKRTYGGTGLGLSIVKGLVEILGGKIWLESEVGVGTTFYFTISYNPSIDLSSDETSENSGIIESETGKRILVVEDDEATSYLIGEVLGSVGSKIEFAMSGKEAIEKAIQFNPDLILMDIGLPDMIGYEVVKEIIKQRPQMKIIAHTAYAAPEDQDDAISSGCVNYISKPVNSHTLLSLILRYLK